MIRRALYRAADFISKIVWAIGIVLLFPIALAKSIILLLILLRNRNEPTIVSCWWHDVLTQKILSIAGIDFY